MKTLKSLTAAAFLMVLSFSSFAKEETKNAKLQMNYALKTYVDAVTHGKLDGIAEVLDTDAKFSMTSSHRKIINYGKSDMLSFLRQQKNTEQNCSTSYNIVEQTGTQAVVKFVMKYENFSKINYISLANTSTGWKITNVSSSFI